MAPDRPGGPAKRLCELRGLPTQLKRSRAGEFPDPSLKERDERDANREIAPLVPAKDAVFVDTTGMTMQEVIDKLKELIAAGAV